MLDNATKTTDDENIKKVIFIDATSDRATRMLLLAN